MYGPHILARTLSRATRRDKFGNAWQYHSRSDHHSKVACWGIVLDLLAHCAAFRTHVADGTVVFGINHEMRDFVHDRKKDLDLVVCTPASSSALGRGTLLTLAEDYEVALTDAERDLLASLPVLRRAPVGNVLVALQAKACMTAHQRALPRLYDELNSSHATVHGSSDHAIAAGFAILNVAGRYLSPDLNKNNRACDPEWSSHDQPRDAMLAVDKVRQLPRRSRPGETGYDALAIVVIDCANDGSEVGLVEETPSPKQGDIHHYSTMIDRLSHLYATRFGEI